MPTKPVHIIGAGGHARVVVDALLCNERIKEQLFLFTENLEQMGSVVAGIRVKSLDDDDHADSYFHVAIGDNNARARLHQKTGSLGGMPLTLVHPKAICSADCEIGEGSFVAAGAIIGPGARIGKSCIINHGAVVDHDCVVSDFVHIAPGAVVTGGVRIGSRVFIGAGAVIQPTRVISDNAIIGAAAMVNVDVEEHAVYVGVPARRLR